MHPSTFFFSFVTLNMHDTVYPKWTPYLFDTLCPELQYGDESFERSFIHIVMHVCWERNNREKYVYELKDFGTIIYHIPPALYL